MDTGCGSPAFSALLRRLAELRFRPEIEVRSAPGPTKLAPCALALNATVTVSGEQIADGRLVVLHDPAGRDSWEGSWRMVLFASAELDTATAQDPVLNDLGWAWLQEALELRGLQVRMLGGTVTRTDAASYGVLEHRAPTGELEIRASWTAAVEPAGPASQASAIAEHVLAWIDLLELITSLDPEPTGVTRLRPPG